MGQEGKEGIEGRTGEGMKGEGPQTISPRTPRFACRTAFIVSR